jgi:glycosyltransferase involved in cell wall biosynthesis
MTAYVLSGPPLSAPYRAYLEAKLGCSLQPLSLTELRDLGVMPMLRRLTSLRAERVIVALEDHSGEPLLPVLRVAAFLTQATEKFVANESRDLKPWSSLDLLRDIYSTIRASLSGIVALLTVAVRSRILLLLRRQSHRLECNRVFFLNAGLWFGQKAGGSVGHLSGVLNAFHGEKLQVLYCSAGGRLMARPEIQYWRLMSPSNTALPPETNTYRLSESVPRQVASTLSAFKPGFLYQRVSLGDVSGVRLSRRYGLPLVIEYNGSEVWAARNWRRPLVFESVPRWAEEACLKHAQLVVTVSDVLREELVSRGIEEDRIVTYPNCIDPEVFNPHRFTTSDSISLRAMYGIEADALVITFLGTFGTWHGITILAQIARQLIEKNRLWLDRNKVRFMFVGDGVKMSEVRDILAGHDPSRYVTFTGLIPQDRAPAFLAASDILCSPHVPNPDGSRFFGSPTKLFEYMAMGKPIIASDLEQIGAVLRNGIRAQTLVSNPSQPASYTAILCTPGSVEDIGIGIRFLVENPEWRRCLGEAARTEALAKYTWSTHVRHILTKLTRVSAPYADDVRGLKRD